MAKKNKPHKARTDRKTARPLVDQPSPQLLAAGRLLRDGRHQEAFDLFRQAVRQEPHNVQAYVRTARAYAKLFQFEKMEAMHEKLTARGPRHPGVHHYLGETYNLLKLPGKALASFQRAAGLPGAAAPTWLELASLCEQSHDLDRARELLDQAAQAGYDVPLMGLVRARLERRVGETTKAEATLRTVIEKFPDAGQWVCQAWGELALLKDQEEDYAGAIAAIDHCKELQRAKETPYLQASKKALDGMADLASRLTREDFDRWRNEAQDLPQLRLALLTGFPRSGTTLLEQLLDAHPDLVSSEERDFIGVELMRQVKSGQGAKPLSDVLNDLNLDQIAVGREQYLPAMEYLLGEAIGDRMHLDKNPAYNLLIPVVLRFFPETRLIIALRDPRDVVLSCYLRYLPLNAVSVQFLTVERTAELYARHMRAWLAYRERIETPWCEVRYENTVADAACEARRALDTLGLAWSDKVLNYRQRLGRERLVSSPTYEAVSQPITSRAIGRWRHYEQHLEPAFDKLEPLLRAFGYE